MGICIQGYNVIITAVSLAGVFGTKLFDSVEEKL